MRPITHIVIHCTATPQHTTVASIQRHWRQVLGWRNPGYHIIVLADGSEVRLASDEAICNGVAGHNSNSIHIAYTGGVNAAGRAEDNRTPAQKATLERLVKSYKQRFPSAEVLGHRDFPNVRKDCPSFDARSAYRLITILGLILGLFAGSGCKSSRTVQTQTIEVRDTLLVEHTITERDTIIHVEADSVVLYVECPGQNDTILEGVRNAKLSLLKSPSGRIKVNCVCDSLSIEAKLRDQLELQYRKRVETVYKTNTVYKTGRFARTMAIVGVVLSMLVVVLIIIQITKIFT